MKALHSIITALSSLVLVLAVLCLAFGSIACSPQKSGDGAQWAAEVQFSMLGKETVTLPTGKKKKIDVVLKDEALELDSGYLDQPIGAFRIVQ